MANDSVLIEIPGATAWITLNRPEQLNAMSPELSGGLAAAFAGVEARADVRAVVITGSGRAFSAGGDLKSFKTRVLSGQHNEFIASLREMMRAFRSIERSRLPVIAAVNGFAVAGGLELLLCCDFVIASETAQIGDGHLKFGVIPGAGSSVRLPRKVPENVARMLLMTGELFPAIRFKEWGLVHEVVPAEQLRHAAAALAERLCKLSPLGLARVKPLITEGLEHSLDDALMHEIDVFEDYMTSADFLEGLMAFEEKREPRFIGR
jgi:enoyl-CoA hydratase/carnithine racemase